MTRNFIDISAKGNYNVITTGWIDLETSRINFTGQFDFPKEKTSFIGYKDLSQSEVLTTGVAITCDTPYKRINMRAQIRTTTPDGEERFIDNKFSIDGSEVAFTDFVDWLYVFTGTLTIRTA
jgi:hypothetical protein